MPGQRVFAVGNRPFLGNWDAKSAHKLSTNGDLYPRWESKEAAELGSDSLKGIEYKYILADDKGKVLWEEGDNRKIDVA